MKIAVLCSSDEHPVYPFLERWCDKQQDRGHDVNLLQRLQELPENGGDVLFLISCSDIVRETVRQRYKKTLVIHASDLPDGRGWSPHVWEIINGSDELTVTLLEATEPVDTGPIWLKRRIHLDGTELYDEINEKLFTTEIELMDFAVENFNSVVPEPQPESADATYYRRRTPEDSKLDAENTISAQFDLLRVCDPRRFPAFFRHRGQLYAIRIEKVEDSDEQ